MLKMLPPDTPATMVMALDECTNFGALKAKLEKQIDLFTEHPVTRNPRIQLVDGQGPVPVEQQVEPPPPPFDEEVVDLSTFEPEHQVHTLAVMRQNGFRFKVRTSTGATGGSAGRRPEIPPRTWIGAARPMRRANCGGEYSTRDCSRLQLDESQRKCFGCGMYPDTHTLAR